MVWYLAFFKWKTNSKKRSFKSLLKKKEESKTYRVNLNEKKKPSNAVSTCNYTLWTFLPKFLFQQLTQFANGLFFVLTCLQLIPNLSPFHAQSTGSPLAFIIACAAFREIIEDIMRYIRDRKINNQLVLAYTDKGWENVKWKKLFVGQLICVTNEECLPADVVFISSSEAGGIAYIETANLDGESSLKIRRSPKETSHLSTEEEVERFWKSNGFIECDAPNKDLHSFDGYIEVDTTALSQESSGSVRIPLNTSHLLLRGSKLRNTDKIFGIAVYTGADTKLKKNSIKRQMKSSEVVRITDGIMCFQFGIALLLAIFCSLVRTFLQPETFLDEIFFEKNEPPSTEFISSKSQLVQFFGFLFLFTGFVPISLYVTLDMVMFIQAFFIRKDEELCTDGKGAEVKMLTLNSELGQVRFVMSDKTGTLTQNCMRFKKCSVGGTKFANKKGRRDNVFNPSKMLECIDQRKRNHKEVHQFIMACAICHTVIVDKRSEGDQPTYHATSPDEAALVNFAATAKYVFLSRGLESFQVEVNGTVLEYKLLHVFEFNSARKRMSVIVQDPQGRIYVYVKGADNVILDRTVEVPHSIWKRTHRHLRQFATEGLRTLCFAYREMSTDEWNQIEEPLQTAKCLLKGRAEALEEVSELCERDLTLVGVSAIEDKLQEQVPEVIEKMMASNIKVWVLTGDKLETAINIGNSCHLLHPMAPMIVLNNPDTTSSDLDYYLNALGDRIFERNQQLSLIVDASSLDVILNNDDLMMDFLTIGLCCSAVICCRCTPIQKALVTRLVKENVYGSVLAIGDGANDVAMIQEADVGVGVSGEEGMQASLAADYAIKQFKHLDRLLFVHGTLSLFRTAKCILFSIYKNIVETAILMFYSFFTGFSDKPISTSFVVMCYNVFFTSWPPIILGTFDRPINVDVLSKFQELYVYYQNSFSLKHVVLWFLNGWIHGFLLLALVYFTYGDGVSLYTLHGRDGHGLLYGMMSYIVLVVVINLKFLLESNSNTIMSGAALFVSFSMLIIVFVWSSFVFTGEADETDLLLQIPYTIILVLILLGIVWTLMTDLTIKAMQRTLFKDVRSIAMDNAGVHGPKFDHLYTPFIKVCDLVGLKHRDLEGGNNGFAFSQDDGACISQVQLLANSVRPNSSRDPLESRTDTPSLKVNSQPISEDKTCEPSSKEMPPPSN